MGATGRNIVKLITGSAVGAGVGALLARGADTTAKRDDPVASATSESPIDSGKGKLTELTDSIRDRWRRANNEGDQAKEAREAELRAYFREKVNDPTAFPPGAPTRTDR
jgi:hypothetical protein